MVRFLVCASVEVVVLTLFGFLAWHSRFRRFGTFRREVLDESHDWVPLAVALSTIFGALAVIIPDRFGYTAFMQWLITPWYHTAVVVLAYLATWAVLVQFSAFQLRIHKLRLLKHDRHLAVLRLAPQIQAAVRAAHIVRSSKAGRISVRAIEEGILHSDSRWQVDFQEFASYTPPRHWADLALFPGIACSLLLIRFARRYLRNTVRACWTAFAEISCLLVDWAPQTLRRS